VSGLHVKSDGSIQAPEGYFAVEITVLTRFKNPANLKSVCLILQGLKATVNKSCGMHIHLDARHLTSREVKKIGQRFAKALPVMLAMVPTTRRNNTYCKASVSDLKGGRYYAVNLTSFNKYKTVEIRLHSSTTDFEKIMNWANLIQAISTSEIKKECNSVNELTDFVKLPENLVEYISQRTSLFSPTSECSSQYLDNDSTDQAIAA